MMLFLVHPIQSIGSVLGSPEQNVQTYLRQLFVSVVVKMETEFKFVSPCACFCLFVSYSKVFTENEFD
jgi:hypothetical protein